MYIQKLIYFETILFDAYSEHDIIKGFLPGPVSRSS